MRITIVLIIINFVANKLCAQKTAHLYFADNTMSIKVLIEKDEDSVRYEIHCKNVSSKKILLPKNIRSQIYSKEFDRIYITWISGDTGLEKMALSVLPPNIELIYYTEKFLYTPNLYIGICYISSEDLAEYSNQTNLNISKMLFSHIAREIIVSCGQ